MLDAELRSINELALIIDEKTRTIGVPSDFLLGVESDEDVERIKFQCPKIVGDNIDLTAMRLYINYQNGNGELGQYLCTDVETSGSDITFSWLLSRNVLKYQGTVTFIVCAKKANEDGTLTNEWNTTTAKGTVLIGLEATEEVVEKNPDVIEQILTELDTIKAGGGSGITSVEVDVENTTGTPSGTGSVEAGILKLSFSGLKGDTGATPNIQIGTVQTLDPGQDATASMTGTPENPLLNLGIPKGGGSVDPEQIKQAVNGYLEENPVSGMTAEQEQQLNQNTADVADLKSTLTGISLGVYGDKVYILLLGEPVGEGLDVSELMKQYDTEVFIADFTGTHPSDAQFYTWDGRIYDGAIYDSLQNIQCTSGTVQLKSTYDNENSRWIKQMICTAGLFESDDFVCEFSAKFCGLAGSWNNVITYGTGTYWTNGMYSDGVKWPASGEIDAFEQSGGYSDNPDEFTLTAHWGSGTASGYPDTHSIERAEKTGTLSLDGWADYKFKLKNGIVTCYMNDNLISSLDLSKKIVNNNYFYNYKPYLKPQAFYIDGSCASSGNSHTDFEYVFEIKGFKILQNENVECNSLEIYPQMWSKGTDLTFPVGAEIFLDKTFSPNNVSNKACVWESSNPLVATVTQGFVKTLTTGSAEITAKCGTATAKYTLNVSDSPSVPCAGLEASSHNISGTEGSRIPLTLYKYPSFTTDSLETHSDDSKIAYFDSSQNEIVLESKGNTNIKISCGGKSVIVSCKVVSSFITGYDFTKIIGEDVPETYDIPDFVPGQTYTISYKIGKLSTSKYYSRTMLQPETGSTNLPPLVVYNTDGTIEVNAGAGVGSKITANVGDWISIVFETPIGGVTPTSATVYVNGIRKEDANPIVYKDYLVTNSSRRPYQNLRENAQGYSSRVEVYYGDTHHLYVKE